MTELDALIGDIVNEMSQYLNEDQMKHLYDVLCIQLHGVQITKECTDIVPSGMDGNEMKLRMFLASKRVENLSPRTLKQYEYQVRQMIKFLQKPVEDVTPMDLRYYIGTIREQKHLATSTIQGLVWCLSSFFSFLETEGIIPRNPVKQLGPIKGEKTIQKPFSAEELEAIRQACENPRDRALVEFLYSTGVRVSELVSLNVGNIQFVKEELIVFGKESKERKTYLTDVARYYLCQYLETRKDEPDLMNRPLFTSLNAPHNRLTVSGVQYVLKQIGKRAGVEDCHPHRFRRTIATDLLRKGMPIEQVKEFLGHEKIDTTMIYCTVSEDSVRSSHHKYA